MHKSLVSILPFLAQAVIAAPYGQPDRCYHNVQPKTTASAVLPAAESKFATSSSVSSTSTSTSTTTVLHTTTTIVTVTLKRTPATKSDALFIEQHHSVGPVSSTSLTSLEPLATVSEASYTSQTSSTKRSQDSPDGPNPDNGTSSSTATTEHTDSTNIPYNTSTEDVPKPTTSSVVKPPPADTKGTGTGARNAAYITNWSIYGGSNPQDIPADKISHLLYAFADIQPDGTVISSDPQADITKPLGGSLSRRDSAHGMVELLYGLKKKNRKLKTLLSIGGWSYSQQGKFNFASTQQGRQTFASSAVGLMANWGMDGIDIDWEYPGDDSEANDYVELLKEIRNTLDQYAAQHSQQYHYLITVAAPAGSSHYEHMKLKAMDQYVDSWNLMTYDFAGSWDQTTGHQANIEPDSSNPASTKFSAAKAIDDYIAAGIAPAKISLGLPLYGRSFTNTDGIGKSYSGVGQGSIEKGVWLYRDLPRPGAKVELDETVGAAYSYDPSSRELVTYDTPASAKLKANYIKSKGLGGAFFWEASGDKSGDDSLIGSMAGSLGALDDSDNMLSYPESKFDNIKN